jgi:hypothetical protein
MAGVPPSPPSFFSFFPSPSTPSWAQVAAAAPGAASLGAAPATAPLTAGLEAANLGAAPLAAGLGAARGPTLLAAAHGAAPLGAAPGAAPGAPGVEPLGAAPRAAVAGALAVSPAQPSAAQPSEVEEDASDAAARQPRPHLPRTVQPLPPGFLAAAQTSPGEVQLLPHGVQPPSSAIRPLSGLDAATAGGLGPLLPPGGAAQLPGGPGCLHPAAGLSGGTRPDSVLAAALVAARAAAAEGQA